MRAITQFSTGVIERQSHAAELDLVVPFTTPELTRTALGAANRMGAGLNPTIRLIRVQVVPFPLEPDRSPVYIEFLKEQMAQFRSDLPVAGEIRLARSFEDGLLGTLGSGSVVILATPKRPWTTRNERLASALRRAGHMVVLVTPGLSVGSSVETKQEPVHA